LQDALARVEGIAEIELGLDNVKLGCLQIIAYGNIITPAGIVLIGFLEPGTTLFFEIVGPDYGKRQQAEQEYVNDSLCH
jgi:hypothetical protein